jgi:hypothetical protein
LVPKGVEHLLDPTPDLSGILQGDQFAKPTLCEAPDNVRRVVGPEVFEDWLRKL